jgi:hypothetical protein
MSGKSDDVSDASEVSVEEREELARRAGERRRSGLPAEGDDRRQGERRTRKPGMRGLIEALFGSR